MANKPGQEEAKGGVDKKDVGNQDKKSLLDTIEASIIAMSSLQWREYLKTLNRKKRNELEKAKSDLEVKRRKIQKAKLAALVTAMAKHEADLKAATDNVKDAVKDLEDIEKVAAMIVKFLAVLEKVAGVIA